MLGLVWWGGVAAGAAATCILCGLLLANMARPAMGFWPSEGPVGKAAGLWLFRLVCLAIVVVAAADLAAGPAGHWLRYGAGGAVTLGAYWITVHGYRYLGVSNTYFGSDGLVTTGLYAYSRNPQYVFSILASLGLALTAASWATLALTGGLFAIYFLFALNEERWLIAGYGREFRDYMARVPRFLSGRSVARAGADLLQAIG